MIYQNKYCVIYFLSFVSCTHLKPKKSVKLKQTKLMIGRGIPVQVANNFTCSNMAFDQANDTDRLYHHNDDYVKQNGWQYSCDCLETVGFIVKPRENGCIWQENPPSPEVVSHEALDKVDKLGEVVRRNRKLGYYRNRDINISILLYYIKI